MTHPLVRPLLARQRLDQFHGEANHLLERIAQLVPGTKLTLLIRTPGHPDGGRDIVLTDDEMASAIAALRIFEAREAEKETAR